MEQATREVEIVGMAITQEYGTLTSGTVITLPASFAAHLVTEAQAAKYTERDLARNPGSDKAGAGGPALKLSEGLTVTQLKEKLAEKGIPFPADAKKAELADLLDASAALVDALAKPSEGLGLDDLRAALVEKGVAFKDDATAAELAVLLDVPAAE